jgi:hypothetical protein
MLSAFRLRLEPAPRQPAIAPRWLFAIFALEAAALFIVNLAGALQFDTFAFFDTGANLTAQSLIRRGYIPTVDFFYHYGLLPLIFGRLWFGVLGLTPWACLAIVPLVDLLVVCGLVRFVTNLRINLAGVLMIALAVPVIVPWSLLNLSHIFEPALIINALADQAAGRRRRALAIAAACVFVKPTMAYFLGLALLVFIVISAMLSDTRLSSTLASEILPAALTALAIASLIAITFGSRALLNSVIPLQGAEAYRAQKFGFFSGAGEAFLVPRGVPWTYYLANPAGPWIAFTIALVLALFASMQLVSGSATEGRESATAEVVCTCAVLHLAFISVFYGNALSWIYYFFILVLGLAAAARIGPRWEIAVACLALAFPASKIGKRAVQHLATVSAAQSASADIGKSPHVSGSPLPVESGFTYQLWFTTFASPVTAGLWATPQERDEWARVMSLALGHRAAVLEYDGCVALLFADFQPPVALYLVSGNDNAAELKRQFVQLQNSSIIVVPRWQTAVVASSPAIAALVNHDFAISFQGAAFTVLARRPSIQTGDAATHRSAVSSKSERPLHQE